MKIRMLTTQRGSPDGGTVRTYEAGTEHELAATARERELADVFLREGWAERADAPKAVPAAPENKDLGAAPENKGEAPPPRRRR